MKFISIFLSIMYIFAEGGAHAMSTEDDTNAQVPIHTAQRFIDQEKEQEALKK